MYVKHTRMKDDVCYVSVMRLFVFTPYNTRTEELAHHDTQVPSFVVDIDHVFGGSD